MRDEARVRDRAPQTARSEWFMNRTQIPFLFIYASAWHLLHVTYKASLGIEDFYLKYQVKCMQTIFSKFLEV